MVTAGGEFSEDSRDNESSYFGDVGLHVLMLMLGLQPHKLGVAVAAAEHINQ